MSVDLRQYAPRYYDGSYEMEELLKSEDYLFDNYFVKELDALKANQFLSTADEETVSYYESLVGIVANPSAESLEFRRSRVINRFALKAPFTLQLLRDRLNAIIGRDDYIMYMDYNTYTLRVEASAIDQQWAEEISIMMNSIKPANIIFRNVPLVTDWIKINEGIQVGKQVWNYRAGTTARASDTKKIAEIVDLTDVLGADTMSIQTPLLDDLATEAASIVASVLINDTTVITDFVVKSALSNTVTIQYYIPESLGIGVVNNIKLKDAGGVNLTNSPVYFTVIGDVLVKHTIPIKEGV